MCCSANNIYTNPHYLPIINLTGATLTTPEVYPNVMFVLCVINIYSEAWFRQTSVNRTVSNERPSLTLPYSHFRFVGAIVFRRYPRGLCVELMQNYKLCILWKPLFGAVYRRILKRIKTETFIVRSITLTWVSHRPHIILSIVNDHHHLPQEYRTACTITLTPIYSHSYQTKSGWNLCILLLWVASTKRLYSQEQERMNNTRLLLL